MSKQFFRVVLAHNLKSGTIELPREFIKEQGKHLPKRVCLVAPTGAESKMKLKRSKDGAFLHKGWQEFVDEYSITAYSFVVFKYEGGSRFSVKIFDLSSSEIEYPIISPTTIHTNAGKRKSGVNPNQSRKLKTRKCDTETRERRVLERVNAFQAPNPHFPVTMTKTYASGSSYLYIPAPSAERHFHKEKNKLQVKLNGADAKTWPMEYVRVGPAKRSVQITVGWSRFALDNNLEKGDICVFEVVNSNAMVFMVTIFRISEPLVNKGPHFRVRITSSCILNAIVQVPKAHYTRYLKEDGHGENNFIVLHGPDGRTWPVMYFHGSSSQDSRSKKVMLSHGWTEFVEDNRVQEGDCCIFEMMMGKAKACKITIIHDL